MKMTRRYRPIHHVLPQPIGPWKAADTPDSPYDSPRALSETGLPSVTLFRPISYEAKYPYPLLVWLFGSRVDDAALLGLMSQVSTRNFGAVGLSGAPATLAQWSGDAFDPDFDLDADDGDADLELFSAIRFARRRMHVHSERIFLVGVGDGGTAALQVGLAYTDCFAGVAALGGEFPPPHARPLAGWRRAQRLPVFFAHRTGRVDAAEEQYVATRRLLHAAGLSVESHFFRSREVPSRILEQLNRWVMTRMT
jgi:phospholipase/carboxylesterase